jgi:hypothetical protein
VANAPPLGRKRRWFSAMDRPYDEVAVGDIVPWCQPRPSLSTYPCRPPVRRAWPAVLVLTSAALMVTTVRTGARIWNGAPRRLPGGGSPTPMVGPTPQASYATVPLVITAHLQIFFTSPPSDRQPRPRILMTWPGSLPTTFDTGAARTSIPAQAAGCRSRGP